MAYLLSAVENHRLAPSQQAGAGTSSCPAGDDLLADLGKASAIAAKTTLMANLKLKHAAEKIEKHNHALEKLEKAKNALKGSKAEADAAKDELAKLKGALDKAEQQLEKAKGKAGGDLKGKLFETRKALDKLEHQPPAGGKNKPDWLTKKEAGDTKRALENQQKQLQGKLDKAQAQAAAEHQPAVDQAKQDLEKAKPKLEGKIDAHEQNAATLKKAENALEKAAEQLPKVGLNPKVLLHGALSGAGAGAAVEGAIQAGGLLYKGVILHQAITPHDYAAAGAKFASSVVTGALVGVVAAASGPAAPAEAIIGGSVVDATIGKALEGNIEQLLDGMLEPHTPLPPGPHP